MTDEERSKCSCFYVSEHLGEDAGRYAAEHLEQVRADPINWTVEYRCRSYGKRWLGDRPIGGTGPPGRLRTFEKVRRDFRSELGIVGALLPDSEPVSEAIAFLRGQLDDLGQI